MGKKDLYCGMNILKTIKLMLYILQIITEQLKQFFQYLYPRELNQSFIPKLIKAKPMTPRNNEGVRAISIKYNVNLLFKVLIFFLLTLRNIGNNK